MKCKICASTNTIKIEDFTPYRDKDWVFEIYDCLECHTRFTIRDSAREYHEEIHSIKNSPYQHHYNLAENIKKTLDTPIECKKALIKKSKVLSTLFEYIETTHNFDLSIMEIGCSTGYVTACLQNLGYKNTLGIDISTSAIAYAKETFGNFYALKEPDNMKYDVIFHIGVIGCVTDPIEFLEYYLDKLKENGVMFFNVPNVNSVLELNELWVSTPPPDLIYLFKGNEFKNILSNKSLEVDIIETLSPNSILKKYINKLRHHPINVYPRLFITKKSYRSHSTKIKKFMKKIIFSIVEILVKSKILKHFSDEYGLIFSVKKISDDKYNNSK
jgi:2-polyprenyl-3-methyl-5-hydroxy-6-metoxy-1,4-benzoquinol methylase